MTVSTGYMVRFAKFCVRNPQYNPADVADVVVAVERSIRENVKETNGEENQAEMWRREVEACVKKRMCLRTDWRVGLVPLFYDIESGNQVFIPVVE